MSTPAVLPLGPVPNSPPHMPISIRQLRFFVALSQTGNFSRAAEAMAVSQPALSASIRQVETILGVRLFERTTHRVNLTEAGEALLPHAWRLLTTADNAFRDMNDTLRRRTTTVRIGTMPSALPALAQFVAGLDQDTRAISVDITDGTSDTLITGLQRGALDMAICATTLIEEGLSGTPLIEDEMALVLGAEHPLAARGSVTWAELAGLEVVHFRSGSIGEISTAAMREANIVHSRHYRVDHMESLFGLVASGLAVGVMPRLYVRGYDPARLAVVALTGPVVRRRLIFLHRDRLAEEHPEAAALARDLVQMLPAALRES